MEEKYKPVEPIPPLNCDEVRRFWYRLGKEVGAKQHAVQYLLCCEKHHARLMCTSEPGVFVCQFCQLEAEEQPTQRIPVVPIGVGVERDTDPIALLPTRPFFRWRLERHQEAGPQTQRHRAVNWKK